MARDKAYYEAEKKIQEADDFWKRARELDLSGIHLTKLPESLRRLTHLEVLDLSNNQLKELPDWIGDLTQLRELRLGSPANNGVLPIGSNPWPSFTDSREDPFSENPVIASMKGLNGRTTLGTIDDYYISYESTLPDPYIGQGTRQTGFPSDDGTPDVSGAKEELKQTGDRSQALPKKETKPGEQEDSPSTEKTNALPNTNVPGSAWVLGCSATAAGDIAAIYDQERYPNLYAGTRSTKNEITDLPTSLLRLRHLEKLDLEGNPLNPELAKAYEQGLEAVKAYLRNKVHQDEGKST